MSYYINKVIGYYEGDRISIEDEEVEKRPSPDHERINGAWVVSQASLQSAIVAEVQKHLDNTAISMGYDDIKTAVTYADEPAVLKFQTEGQALRAWRSLVWEKCYAELARVVSGERTIPTPEEAIAELPVFVPPGEA